MPKQMIASTTSTQRYFHSALRVFLSAAMVLTTIIPQARAQFDSWTQGMSADKVTGSAEAELETALRMIKQLEARDPNHKRLDQLRSRAALSAETVLKKITERLNSPQTPEAERQNLQKRGEFLVAVITHDVEREAKKFNETLSELLRKHTGRENGSMDDVIRHLSKDELSRLKSSQETLESRISHLTRQRAMVGMTGDPRIDFSLNANPNSDFTRGQQRAVKGAYWGGRFVQAYFTFQVATFIVSLHKYGMNYHANPMAFEALTASNMIAGMPGFAAFMAADHYVARKLHGVKNGIIPKRMIPYLGMAAGSVASSLVHELWADQDLHKCINSTGAAIAAQGKNVNGLNPSDWFDWSKRDEPACKKAWNTWTVHGKILQYTPAITSLLASSALAGGTQAALAAGYKYGKQGAQVIYRGAFAVPNNALTITTPNFSRAVVPAGPVLNHFVVNQQSTSRALTIIPEMIDAAKAASQSGKGVRFIRALGQAAAANFTPVGMAITLGHMTLFVMWDEVLAAPTEYAFEGFRLSTFDIKNFLDRSGFHREYTYLEDGQTQAIKDAFDTEAKNLQSAHKYYVSLFDHLQKSSWQRPLDPKTCAPPELPNGFWKDVRPYTDWVFTSWFSPLAWANLGALTYKVQTRGKSNEQLACEVVNRPGDLIKRYAEVNGEWRQKHLLMYFTRAQDQWLRITNRFNVVYQAARTVAQHIANEKFAVAQGKKAAPDLSRQAFLTALGGQPGDLENAPVPPPGPEEAVHPPRFGNVQTKELLDYVLTTLACGPSPDPSQNINRPIEDATAFVRQKVFGQMYIKTPYGSSFNFVPPRITTESGRVCHPGLTKLTPKTMGESIQRGNVGRGGEVFNGSWMSESTGKVYKTLADYIYDHLDPEMVDSNSDQSPFSEYWMERVVKPVGAVWEVYANSYDKMIRELFTPVVFDRTYRKGCVGTTGPGKDGSGVGVDAADPRKRTGSDGLLVPFKTVSGQRDVECSDSSAYRVGNGLLLSTELQMRNYLRSLHAVLSSVSKGPMKERAKFMELGNSLIAFSREIEKKDLLAKPPRMNVLPRGQSPSADVDDLFTEDWVSPIEKSAEDAQKKLGELVRLVAMTMKEVQVDEKDFRYQLVLALGQQISELITENQKYTEVVRAFEFGSSTARPVDQKVDGQAPRSILRKQ